MVVFTCNHCGDTLHKPTVEKHYAYVCRKNKSLTCVDCLKDFSEEYAMHTKCVTEEERYAAKGSMPNGVVKKGELKQESWVEMIKSILDVETNLRASQKNLLQTISNYDNIPRKKPKFMNFIRSSSGGRVNMKDVDDVWNIIEKYKNNKSSQNGANTTENEQSSKPELAPNKRKTDANSAHEAEQREQKKKKKKHSNNENDEITDESTNLPESTVTEKFNFQTKILSVLESKGSISLKKLEKKVINAYLKHSGITEASPKTVKKFNKKLKKVPNVEITNENVLLKQ